jgi:hypothetical protein
MNSTHTPTPWFAKREGFSTVYIEARLRPGVLQEVAACGPTEAGSEQQDANAAYIVKAVNSHHKLVAALKAVVEFYSYAEFGPIADARATLAAAGEPV